MSLAPCPECGEEVSTNATACPKCGYRVVPDMPDPLKSPGYRAFKWGSILLMLLMLPFLAFAAWVVVRVLLE